MTLTAGSILHIDDGDLVKTNHPTAAMLQFFCVEALIAHPSQSCLPSKDQAFQMVMITSRIFLFFEL